MSNHFAEILPARYLGREGERLLFERARRGHRGARDLLVVSNLRFVLQVARHYHCPAFPLSDLVNEGCLGLIRAVESFEPERNVRFLSYAVWWIRAAILKALSEQSGLIRMPAGQGREKPSILPLDSLLPQEALVSSSPLPSGESIGTAGHSPMDARESYPGGLLADLPKREAQVLLWIYGLDFRPRQSLRQVAEIMGLSHQRVRQLRDKALLRLRRKVPIIFSGAYGRFGNLVFPG